MRSYSVFSRAALWAALVFVGDVTFRNTACAQSMDTYEDALASIHDLRTNRVIMTVTVAPIIDTICVDMLEFWSDAAGLKQEIVRGVTPSKVGKWRSAAYAPEGDILALIYATRQGVPDNFTDVRLKGVVAGHGAMVKRNTERLWKSKSITTNELQAIEIYEPSIAAEWVYVITDPWYISRRLPVGASSGTWASDSYRNVVQNIRLAEFAKRSVVVKLLANMGEITISPTVDAQFIYSGWPDVVINISFTLWSQDDVPELNRLLANPHYHDAAQAELNALSVVEN